MVSGSAMDRPASSAIPFAPLAALLAVTLRFGGVDRRRALVYLAILSRYGALEPLRLAERWRTRGIAGVARSADPIFVVGHWRSGTSYLQGLLSADPRFTTTTLYNTIFADVAGVARWGVRPSMEWIVRALDLPHSLQRTSLSLDLVGEGDVGLCCQLSPYAYTWGHLFPRRFADWFARCVLDPSPEHERGWLAHLDRYIQTLSWDAGGKRVVMKSPGDTGRIASLAARYPDARFVFIHRDPIAVFHSNRHLWGVIRREIALQVVTDREVDEVILRTYRALLERYLAQRGALAEGRLVEIGYEALLQDPSGGLEHIYRALDLGKAPVVAPGRHRPHAYQTSPALEQRIRRAWAFSYAEWNHGHP